MPMLAGNWKNPNYMDSERLKTSKPRVERIEQHAKCYLLILKGLVLFQLCHAHMKKTPGSPHVYIFAFQGSLGTRLDKSIKCNLVIKCGSLHEDTNFFQLQTRRFLHHLHPSVEVVHCENTWVTLTIFLGCLSCISVTKKC